MTRRRIPGAAFLAVVALVAYACSNGVTPTPPTPAPSATSGSASRGASGPPASAASIEASGDIFAFGVSNATSDVIAQGRVDKFRELYPNVTVTFGESGFDAQRFLTALQSSDKPDVVRIPRDRLGTYVNRGIIDPIDECISRTGTDMSNYYESAVRQVTLDGKVYAMPESFWVSNWIIDDELFKQAGLDPATWDVGNWDQITAANKALIEKTQAKVAIDPGVWDDGDRFPEWVAAAGGTMLSDDGMESRLDTPEVAAALTFTKSLIDAQGGVIKFRAAIGQTGNFQAGDEFSKNLEAAFPMQQWYLNVLAGSVPTTRFTARPFLTRSGQAMTYEEGDALAIVASSDNKDAACAFITTMTSTDAWIAGATRGRDQAASAKKIQTGTVTGNKAADQQIFSSIVDLSSNPTFKAAVDAYTSTFDTAFGMPSSPAAEEFRQAWVDAVNSVLAGDKDAQTALRAADQEAQSAIDNAKP